MPQSIDNVSTGNDYTAAATIQDVFNSNGGYFTITTADVYAELQYGGLGLTEWTTEVHVPVGTGEIGKGTTGIRFRSYKAGTPGTVTAAIYYNAEPSFVIGSGGQAVQVSAVGGQVGVAWPGGSPNSTVVTVAHGLGRVPNAVTATVNTAGVANTGTFALVPLVGSIGSTTFNLFVATGDGSSPPNTAVAAVCWIAV